MKKEINCIKKFINKLIFEFEKDQNLTKYILEFKFVIVNMLVLYIF